MVNVRKIDFWVCVLLAYMIGFYLRGWSLLTLMWVGAFAWYYFRYIRVNEVEEVVDEWDEDYEDERPTKRFVLDVKTLEEMPPWVTPVDILIEHGFDPNKEFTWWHDPLTGNRIFKQEE